MCTVVKRLPGKANVKVALYAISYGNGLCLIFGSISNVCQLSAISYGN